jgi:hypothetical protein
MAVPSRNSTTRAATARPALGGHDGGTLTVDTSALPEDMELMWATEQVLGADYRENVRMQMHSRAFMPVLVSDMPGEAPPMMPGEKRDEHALIRRGGLVLMKRPKRQGIAERAELRADNAEALRSVNRDFEEQVRQTNGLERLKDAGVTERTERRAGASAFPE